MVGQTSDIVKSCCAVTQQLCTGYLCYNLMPCSGVACKSSQLRRPEMQAEADGCW